MDLKTAQELMKTLESANKKEAWEVIEQVAKSNLAVIEEKEEKGIIIYVDDIVSNVDDIASKDNKNKTLYGFQCSDEYSCGYANYFYTNKPEDKIRKYLDELPFYCSFCGKRIIWRTKKQQKGG